MEEKMLNQKKNGMAMLLLLLALYAAAVACLGIGIAGTENGGGALYVALCVAVGVWMALGWIFFCGLKVLKPQEALRKMILDGAVGMVEMALEHLNENHTVELDEERKAAMVSNLLVVLCGNRDAQPVVNSGSLY